LTSLLLLLVLLQLLLLLLRLLQGCLQHLCSCNVCFCPRTYSLPLCRRKTFPLIEPL
jgi:hypothetical protein